MSRDVQFSSRLSPFEYEYRFTEYEYDFCVKRLLGNKTIGMPVVRGTFSHEAAKFCTLILLICLAFISSSISNAQPSNSDSASSKDVANSNEVKSPPIDTQSSNSPTIIVVVGASGSATYEGLFRDWSKQWVDAAKRGKATIHTIGVDPSNGSKSDRDRLADVISEECQRGRRELWIVLIGHGTFDRRDAKFNLRGPDVSADELAKWLQPYQRPAAIVNCASASGPFLVSLAGPNRIVISATKSGGEQNFTRFGDFLASSLSDATADLDKDDQVSLWEAFLAASRKTAEFYSTDGRLQTEHAMLDDNGDGMGVRADQFQGLIPREKPASGILIDGLNAHQWHLIPNEQDAQLAPEVLTKRNQIELSVAELKGRKSEMSEADYWLALEQLLVELAELNESAGPR